MKVWSSYYGGTCGNCHRTFNTGTRVRWEGGVLVEDECPDGPAPEDAAMGPKERAVYREQMCLKCFTVHAPGQEGCQ